MTKGFLSFVHGPSLPSYTRYGALSHCWGQIQQVTLLRSHLSDYSRQIPVPSLPKSFAEASEICTDFGTRYLWVGSLCIVQDDPDEWAAEAPRMAEIYSNSYVTIAATASRNDTEGLIRPLNPCLMTDLAFEQVDKSGKVYRYSVQKTENFADYVNAAPLNQRAWVLQEQSLSRRVLHFAKDQIYWQCPSKVWAQFDLISKTMESSSWRSVMRWTEQPVAPDEGALVSRNRPGSHPLLKKWDDLADEYSKCDLTYHSDKLVAISGPAKRIQDLTSWPETDYLAGIWRQGLPRRLLWYTNIYSATKPDALPSWRTGIRSAKKPNLLPSWSWAHINDHTVYSLHIWSTNDGDSDIAEVLAAHTTPLQDPFGSIKDGVIVLRGKLYQVRLEREPSGQDTQGQNICAGQMDQVAKIACLPGAMGRPL